MLHPSVAVVRVAVREALRDQVGPVLVACSGGPDSLALAAATAFVAPRLGLRAGLVTVDHGLQVGSAERAEQVAVWARGTGFDPVQVSTVDVGGPGGPEAAARDARYAALVEAAHAIGATAILLGHTRDDQAETVLLALARGAGPRGLAGMPVRRDVEGVTLLRPVLDLSREVLAEACAVQDLKPWADPHNSDPAYARARVRTTAMPALVAALGPAVVANLARTARLLAADAEQLDAEATTAAADATNPGGSLRVAALRDLPAALRGRVLHGWALSCGATPGALSHRHVDALDALVMGWHGQGAVHLPGGATVRRRAGNLELTFQ